MSITDQQLDCMSVDEKVNVAVDMACDAIEQIIKECGFAALLELQTATKDLTHSFWKDDEGRGIIRTLAQVGLAAVQARLIARTKGGATC